MKDAIPEPGAAFWKSVLMMVSKGISILYPDPALMYQVRQRLTSQTYASKACLSVWVAMRLHDPMDKSVQGMIVTAKITKKLNQVLQRNEKDAHVHLRVSGYKVPPQSQSKAQAGYLATAQELP